MTSAKQSVLNLIDERRGSLVDEAALVIDFRNGRDTTASRSAVQEVCPTTDSPSFLWLSPEFPQKHSCSVGIDWIGWGAI
jgi:hypothetical protein